MSLESDSILSWHNLNLWIPPLQRNNSNKGFSLSLWKPKTQPHLVLKNVSGYAKFGSLLAIMGPSGSGKTTLLASISKRACDGVTGDILLNGKPICKDLMLRISGFMPQKDLAVETLTVEEHIEFMAILKSDIRVTPIQRKNIESDLLNDLGLTQCKKTLLQNLSGGERKRLALAVQMIIDPPILFCDEPTTGLDSFSASAVISVLKRLASQGKAVICSIHQPSSDVFMLFDQLCLLLPGGHLAYHGDMEGAKLHFRSIGFQFPKSYNPADYILQILNPSTPSDSEKLIDAFNRSIAKVKLSKELENLSTVVEDNHIDLFYGVEPRFHRYYSIKNATMLIQLRLLVWRAAISMYRNLQQIFLRSLLYIFTGLLVSTPYIGVRLDQEGIQNLQGFHYAVITETIFCHAYNIMQTFPSEIPILLREMGNGIYKPGPYYFSKVLIILPRAVIETLIFCTVCFCVVGGASDFLLFSAPVIASAVTSSAYGCFISAMFKNISTASLVSVPVDFLTYAFCGLFIQLNTVPMYLRWVKYISRFYYGIEAISILQWQEIDNIPCSENENMPCITTGQGVLEKYGFSESNLSLDFFAMLVGFIILHIFGFLSLKYRSRQQSVY